MSMRTQAIAVGLGVQLVRSGLNTTNLDWPNLTPDCVGPLAPLWPAAVICHSKGIPYPDIVLVNLCIKVDQNLWSIKSNLYVYLNLVWKPGPQIVGHEK